MNNAAYSIDIELVSQEAVINNATLVFRFSKKNAAFLLVCSQNHWSLYGREIACSASDRQGSNVESCVWRAVSHDWLVDWLIGWLIG